jgi:acyl-CoA thioester hydrolase
MEKNENKEPEILESFHTVSSYELDSFGHVNNSVFLNYLEKARCDYMELKGMGFYDFLRWHRFPVVARATLNYKKPAYAGDRLIIKGCISAHTKTSFTMKYRITCSKDGKEQLVLEGETFHVFVDDNNRPSRIPEEFFENFIKPSPDTL